MVHHIIYIPGLGDKRSYNQDKAIKQLRLFRLRPHYFPLRWADNEPFEPKLKRLLKKIDELKADGNSVSLIGVSAGASAALNAFARRPDIAGVVCISGKIQNPRRIEKIFFELNPAFEDSMFMVQDSLKKLDQTHRKRIMSVHPLSDKTVPPDDTKISGAVEKTVPVRGHIPSIIYCLTLGLSTVARFLKRQQRNLK